MLTNARCEEEGNKGAVRAQRHQHSLVFPEAWLWREGKRRHCLQGTYSQEKDSQLEGLSHDYMLSRKGRTED